MEVEPQVRRLMRLVPGPDLGAALARLSVGQSRPCRHDHRAEAWVGEPEPGSAAGFVCGCQVVIAAAWQAQATWTAQQASAHLVAVAGAHPVQLPDTGPHPALVDPSKEELAAAVGVSPVSMGNRISAARSLAAHRCLEGLAESGLCSWWTVRSVLAEVEALAPDEAAVVAEAITAKLRDRHAAGLRPWTCGEAVAAARRLRLRLFPGSARKAAAKARSGRGVHCYDGTDGMSDLLARLPTPDAQRIHRRLTSLAAGLDDPTRTADQKRADTLTDLLLAAPPASSDSPASRGSARPDCGVQHRAEGGDGAPRVEMCVVVDLATLLGLSENPAHLPGHGPLSPEAAREVAADARWRAWITDAAGRVTAVGATTYRPSAGLARLVRAREPVCRMPGCRRAARLCDLDHTVAWPNGPSTVSNIGPLCRRHHNQKTRKRWLLRNDTGSGQHPPVQPGEPPPEGHAPTHFTWTTPAGATVTDNIRPALE